MLNYEHLFDQADKLARSPGGVPRQVDLRRAVSAAYHGLFHFTMTAVADTFAGKTKRAIIPYKLAYRSVDHRTLRDAGAEALKQKPSAR